jgi:hypothetical protein
MTNDDQIERLQAERDLYRAKVLELVQEIREVLHEDLELFVQRKIRDLFLAAPAVARALTDERLKALKQGSREVAEAVRDRIIQDLQAEVLWLEPGEVEEKPAGLAANPRVWREVNQVCEVVLSVAREFGLPEPAEPLVYQEPRRFIRSRLLTTLTEKYWSNLALYRSAARDMDALEDEAEKAELARRWDALD